MTYEEAILKQQEATTGLVIVVSYFNGIISALKEILPALIGIASRCMNAIRVGDAKRSVYVSNFVIANLNTIVYYVAVYISKTTGQVIAQSPVATATVN